MKLHKFLFYYCAIFSLFIVVSALISRGVSNSLFIIALIPLPLYFSGIIIRHIKNRKSLDSDETSFPGKKGALIFYLLVFLVLVGYSVNNIVSRIPQAPPQEEPPATPPPVAKESETETNKQNLKIVIKTDNSNGTVNVRKSPSLSSPIIGIVKNGDVFTLISKKDGWYQINMNEEKPGWIDFHFTETIKP